MWVLCYALMEVFHFYKKKKPSRMRTLFIRLTVYFKESFPIWTVWNYVVSSKCLFSKNSWGRFITSIVLHVGQYGTARFTIQLSKQHTISSMVMLAFYHSIISQSNEARMCTFFYVSLLMQRIVRLPLLPRPTRSLRLWSSCSYSFG